MKCTSTRGKGTREIFITAVQTEQFLDIETCRSVDISCTACCQKHIVGLFAQQLTQIQPSSGSKKLDQRSCTQYLNVKTNPLMIIHVLQSSRQNLSLERH